MRFSEAASIAVVVAAADAKPAPAINAVIPSNAYYAGGHSWSSAPASNASKPSSDCEALSTTTVYMPADSSTDVSPVTPSSSWEETITVETSRLITRTGTLPASATDLGTLADSSPAASLWYKPAGSTPVSSVSGTGLAPSGSGHPGPPHKCFTAFNGGVYCNGTLSSTTPSTSAAGTLAPPSSTEASAHFPSGAWRNSTRSWAWPATGAPSAIPSSSWAGEVASPSSWMPHSSMPMGTGTPGPPPSSGARRGTAPWSFGMMPSGTGHPGPMMSGTGHPGPMPSGTGHSGPHPSSTGSWSAPNGDQQSRRGGFNSSSMAWPTSISSTDVSPVFSSSPLPSMPAGVPAYGLGGWSQPIVPSPSTAESGLVVPMSSPSTGSSTTAGAIFPSSSPSGAPHPSGNHTSTEWFPGPPASSPAQSSWLGTVVPAPSSSAPPSWSPMPSPSMSSPPMPSRLGTLAPPPSSMPESWVPPPSGSWVPSPPTGRSGSPPPFTTELGTIFPAPSSFHNRSRTAKPSGSGFVKPSGSWMPKPSGSWSPSSPPSPPASSPVFTSELGTLAPPSSSAPFSWTAPSSPSLHSSPPASSPASSAWLGSVVPGPSSSFESWSPSFTDVSPVLSSSSAPVQAPPAYSIPAPPVSSPTMNTSSKGAPPPPPPSSLPTPSGPESSILGTLASPSQSTLASHPPSRFHHPKPWDHKPWDHSTKPAPSSTDVSPVFASSSSAAPSLHGYLAPPADASTEVSPVLASTSVEIPSTFATSTRSPSPKGTKTTWFLPTAEAGYGVGM